MPDAGVAPRLRMLRRGRGNGYREALRAGRPAADAVIHCVLDDPRWDRQVESREGYYARLLIELNADISPLAERILREGDDAEESDIWLAVSVLAELARRRHTKAIEALVGAIRQGRRWRACLNALDGAGGESLIRAVMRAEDVALLVGSVDVESLGEAVQNVAAPWQAWASAVPGLRFVLGARKRPGAPPGPPAFSPNMTSADLLEFANEGRAARDVAKLLKARRDPATTAALRKAATAGTPQQRMVALPILGERGCADFVVDAEEFLREQSRLMPGQRKELRTQHGFLRYLDRLPAAITLERARQWFREPRPLRLAAEQILVRHATADDRGMLETAGWEALASDDMYRLCSVVDALATIGSAESLPFFSEAYSEASYSYARGRVLSALVPYATHRIAHDSVVEALWDCEFESRELASGAVLSNELPAASRLAEIADDEFEEPTVREAAQRARVKGR